jgi:hypothetical protein
VSWHMRLLSAGNSWHYIRDEYRYYYTWILQNRICGDNCKNYLMVLQKNVNLDKLLLYNKETICK